MKEYFYKYRKIDADNNGYSLLEILVTVVIIGILSAIAAPNVSGLFSHNRVLDAMSTINGAIKEGQMQAIRLGKTCRVNINTDTNIISGNPPDCLLKDRNIHNSIDIRTNLSGTPPNIIFSHKGNTTKAGKIVVSSETTDTQRCFAVSIGVGITRTGNYSGLKTGSVTAGDCDPDN